MTALISSCKDDISLFVRHFFPSLILEKFQADILKFIDEKMREGETEIKIALQAGKGVGKTMLQALVLIWALFTQKTPSIRVMSGKLEQTKSVTLREISRLLDISKGLRQHVCLMDTQVRLKKKGELRGDRSQAIVCQVLNPENADKVAGDHSPSNVFVVDEATTMDRQSFLSLCGVFATGRTIFMLCGNPTKKDSIFYDITTNYEDWKTFVISGEEVTRKDYNLESMARTYGGKGSFLYNIYVAGRWADQDEGRFFSASDISPLFDLYNTGETFRDSLLTENHYIGLDVASGCYGDYSVAVYRVGFKIKILFRDNRMSAGEIRDKIAGWTTQGVKVIIDASGMGNSIYVELKRMGIYGVLPFKGGDKPFVKGELYLNAKSLMYARMKEWLLTYKPYIVEKTGDTSDILRKELLSIPYDFISGMYNIGDKRKMTRSPDIADALSFTFYFGI